MTPDYKEMYYKLFNELTNIIEQLQNIQKNTEELYINSGKPPISIAKTNDTSGKISTRILQG